MRVFAVLLLLLAPFVSFVELALAAADPDTAALVHTYGDRDGGAELEEREDDDAQPSELFIASSDVQCFLLDAPTRPPPDEVNPSLLRPPER